MPQGFSSYRVGAFVARNDREARPLPHAAIESVLGSVLDFWKDTTGGFLRTHGSEVLSSVDIAVGQDPRDEQIVQTSYEALYAAESPKHPGESDPVRRFHCFLVFVHPGYLTYANPKAGADPAEPATVTRPLRAVRLRLRDGRPMALVPSDASFSLICHELGHTFGFEHPWGLVTYANDNLLTAEREASPEYGSPYDIMGTPNETSIPGASPSWTYTSSYEVPADGIPDGWPASAGSAIGPNLSRAQLHHRWPDALLAVKRRVPVGAATERAAVRAPTTDDAGSVFVLRPDDEPADKTGRIVVEYRTAQGRDLGLADAPSDLAREGVVVHQFQNGQPWFRGAIRKGGVDVDLVVSTPEVVITVEEWNEDSAIVVASAVTSPRCTVEVLDESSRLASLVDGERKRTPCGDEYLVGTWKTTTRVVYAARATGFGGGGEFSQDPPTVAWSVGGVDVPAAGGTVTVPVSALSAHAIRCAIDPQKGHLTVTTGVGERLRLDVEARVADAGGMSARGDARLLAEGSYRGIDPGALPAITKCIEKNIPVAADIWQFKRPSDPVDEAVIDPRIERLRQRWVDQRLQRLERTPGIESDAKTALAALIKAQGPPG